MEGKIECIYDETISPIQFEKDDVSKHRRIKITSENG